MRIFTIDGGQMTHHDDETQPNNNAERNYQVRVDVEWKIVVQHEREALKAMECYGMLLGLFAFFLTIQVHVVVDDDVSGCLTNED
jgi:hypothetical protein